MKDKLVKAYRAAWRWPEVYSAAPSIVWTSRAIAFLVPLGLLVLTIVTGVPLFGWAATGIIASFISLALILTTVRMFYEEFETVEDFETREARIKEFFHGFPKITDVPLIEHDEGEWIAYGHIPPEEFITAIQTVVLKVTEDPDRLAPYIGLENSVGHLYATFSNPEEGHWGEGIVWCKPTSENCFPITRVEV